MKKQTRQRRHLCRRFFAAKISKKGQGFRAEFVEKGLDKVSSL